MTSFLTGYDNFMLKYQDTRTRDWFLVGKTGQLLLILVGYVYFCTKLGPRLMRDRKPFELKKTIQGYNLAQVLLNVYLVYQGIRCGWGTTYKFSCEPVDYSDAPHALRMRNAVWLYFINKLVELLDTVFFILRKKYNQVTYLHLYHHTLMPVCAFIGVTFVPGGHGSLLGVINSFIHVVMYAYYFLSSFGPEIQKYLWWKRYVTRLQLIQFAIVFVHNFQALFRECSYPKVFNFLLAFQAGYFTYLFGKFYVRAYIHKKPQITIVKDEVEELKNNNKITNGAVNGHVGNGHISNGHANHYENGHVANGVHMNNNVSNGKILNANYINGAIKEGITGICHGTLPENESCIKNGKPKIN